MYSSAQNFLKLVEATQTNDVDTVHHFMWACNPKDRNSLPFITAARFGSLECLEALKTVSDVTSNDAQAFKEAAKNGHLECVKFLWKLCIPTLNHRGEKALAEAASTGQLHIVEYLLERGADPRYKRSTPLQMAAIHHQYETVDFLYPHSSPSEALNALCLRSSNIRNQWQWFEEYVQSKDQKNILTTEICNASNPVSIARKI